MIVLEWIRFLAGTSCLLCGLIIFVLELFGVFKFHYVLNRMHAAALGDTLGIGLSMLGLVILCGWNLTSLKMILCFCGSHRQWLRICWHGLKWQPMKILIRTVRSR